MLLSDEGFAGDCLLLRFNIWQCSIEHLHPIRPFLSHSHMQVRRSEERRVGKECSS